MILLTIFVILALYIGYLVKNHLRFRRIINKFPGRKSNLLLGDVVYFTLQQDEVFRTLRDYAQEFPDGYRLHGGQYSAFHFLIAEDVEVILSSSRHIEKNRVYEVLQNWLGTGLLTSTGKKWAHRRKILTPAFHFNILRRFIAIFNAHSEIFIEELREECNKPHTDIVPIISALTLNIICETAMGIGSISNVEKLTEYRNAVHRLGTYAVKRILSPWLYLDFIHALTPSGREETRLLKILHQFTSEVIDAREETFDEREVENMENSNDVDTGIFAKKRLAMLDLLLLAKRRGEIDDQGIREEVDTFMFEGHDTVSIALSFCLFALANNKHVQDKARAEIDEIFGDSSRSAEYRDLLDMVYLEMVIKESLRLYPSVPLIMRRITEDVPFRNGKYMIPKGCFVHISIFDLHRNATVFPDPEKFDPDRFLPENVKGRHPYAYVPFSAGPRNCIGQKFALLEMKCLLSAILRHYEILPIDTTEDLKMIADLVLRAVNGIRVKFIPRSK